MSHLLTAGEEASAASTSNALTYPPLPSAESEEESNDSADGSAVGNSVGNSAGKQTGKPDKKRAEETDNETDDETDEEDTPARKMTPTEKLEIIQAIIKAKNENTDIQAAAEEAMPRGVSVNFREFQAHIHPDKFPDPKEKQSANEAFQILGSLRDSMETGSREVDKHNAFHFGNDPNRPKAHVEGELSPYHKTAHKDATKHLKIIYEAVKDNISFTPENPPAGKIKESISKLEEINQVIRKENKENHEDTDLGIVRYLDFLGKWRPLLSTDNRETKKEIRKALSQYCEQMHYPTTWASEPPYYKKKTDKANKRASDRGAASERTANPEGDNAGAANAGVANAGVANAGVANPGSIQEGFNNSGTSLCQSMVPQEENTIRTKQVIRTKPQTVQRKIEPGLTSSKEEILAIQPLGLGARLVVKNESGDIRLISSSSAGGIVALEGAREKGVPSTLSDPAGILALRDLVRSGGEYGLEFVAIGEWDIYQKRLPFIVVLFFHETEEMTRREALSRCALKKILPAREAENLIVQSITGETDMSLREALISQLSLEVREKIHTGRNGPLLLPHGEAPQQWWVQNGQQLGPQAFHAGPVQQQYLPYPQGFAPQYMQQPPSGQLQRYQPQLGNFSQQEYQSFPAAPFSMPPQLQPSLFGPATSKYSAKSPLPQPQLFGGPTSKHNAKSPLLKPSLFGPATSKHSARSPPPSPMNIDKEA